MRLSQISMYVPEDVKEGLKQLAEENYQMFSDYVRLVLTRHVKENLKKDKNKDWFQMLLQKGFKFKLEPTTE